jgi:serine/threonine protein kinase
VREPVVFVARRCVECETSYDELLRYVVIDFGGATYDDERKGSIINTRQYRGPEVTLEMGWSFPSDIWSAACIIAELYTGELLFATVRVRIWHFCSE